MSALTFRPALRWAVPVGVAVAVFGVSAASTALRAAADPSLPSRSAAQLLVDLQTAQLEALSGTVVLKSDLGLPALPVPVGGAGLDSLIAGSHTLRIWYAGPEKVRLALLGTLGESDVIRNGRDVWIWASKEQTAQHSTLPAGFATAAPRRAADLLPITPQEAADKILAALDPSTVVSTAGTARVAGRAAYELVIAPRDAASLVGQVRLAIDGQQHVPLRVRVYAKGRAAPAFEVGFEQISFAKPGDEQFRFNPPPGTTVKESTEQAEPTKPGAPTKPAPQETGKPGAPTKPPVAVIGTGWTTVIAARLPGTGSPSSSPADREGGGNPIGALLGALPRVSGTWGSGRLLTTRLFSVLLTDDGRILVGAVSADRLYAVASDPAATLK
ncbi:MAG TPA: sigma-E factor regulatory protein RseB domain-containing protein [Micromonosporaceae bacterium]|nr:sigma-E factor regulatory protein RseB domain-containing protein [Micromonosporaceae bacterium]